jgi:hypothetical protein
MPIFVAFIALLAAAGSGGSQLVQPLEPGSVFLGCGCAFNLLPKAPESEVASVFSSNYEGAARIRSYGRVVALSADRPDTACRPGHVGDRCTLTYRSPDMQVTLNLRATEVCAVEDESCEVVRLHGQLKARGAGSQVTVEVEGECGC